MSAPIQSRRAFLRTGVAGGAGLIVAFRLLPRAAAAGRVASAPADAPFAPNAFLRIGPGGDVTILAKHSEMGQGAYTSLAMCVAEELDADWARVSVQAAPTATAYSHTAYGMQMTGGSTSTWESYEQMRRAGATARALLVQAAANRWKADPAALRTEKGFVIGPAGSRADYGSLAAEAAGLPPPQGVVLKNPGRFNLIGKPVRRVDSTAKVNGTAVFGIDVRIPGMLTAVLARPPVFGGKLRGFDGTAARAVPGVRKVAALSRGVAVIADNFWAAKKGRDALKVDWEPGPLAALESEGQKAAYLARIAGPGATARKEGDAAAAFSSAASRIEATFDFPYLAHAAMEPLNATARVGPEGVEVWAPTQFQTVDQMNAAKAAGVPPERVTLHTTLLGGGFGRKANPVSDFVVEAVEAAKAAGAPVRVVWLREDDMRGGFYRPRTVVSARLGLDASGRLVSWENHIASQSIMLGTPFAGMVKDGIDPTQVEGLADLPYSVPNLRVDWHPVPDGAPVLWWRSVGHSYSAFVKETLVDDAARAAGADPIEYRIGLLGAQPRQAAVLRLLREKSNWGRAAQGRFQGVAIHESFGSIVGEVAELSVSHDVISVHKVTAVVDCGHVVNPDTVRAQVMSAVVYGLSAALYGRITLRDGQPEQSNFNDYPVLRMADAPVVETHILESGAAMGGVGEPGLPPVAPAVSNAVLAATGRRLRTLPMAADHAV